MNSRVSHLAITILLSAGSVDCGGDEPKQEYPVETSKGGAGGKGGTGTGGSAAGSCGGS